MTFKSQNNIQQDEYRENLRNLGIVLLLIGAISLGGMLFNLLGLAEYYLLVLAAIFLGLGMINRSVAWVIPGSILAGIGSGILLITRLSNLAEATQAGVFLLAFTAGWLLLSALGSWLERELYWWPLIPAAFMLLIALALLGGGWALNTLNILGRIWPFVLVAAGFFLLLRFRQSTD